ncbi:MAG: hypothetical protein ACM3YE_06155 [Bacteroidota bacterium]
MLCEEAVGIPFDLKNYGVGIYKDNNFRFRTIEKELMKRLKEIAVDANKPDNPYLDFISHSKGTGNISNNIDKALKVNIVNGIDGENMLRPPRFYRQIESTPRHNIRYKKGTVFTFVIELLSYSSENISVLNTELTIMFGSNKFITSQIYNQDRVNTSTSTVSIKSDYRSKFTIKPKSFMQQCAAFVLDELIPFELTEMKGIIKVTDMYGNIYESQEFRLETYAIEPDIIIKKTMLMEKFGEGSSEYEWRVRMLENDGTQTIDIDELMG